MSSPAGILCHGQVLKLGSGESKGQAERCHPHTCRDALWPPGNGFHKGKLMTKIQGQTKKSSINQNGVAESSSLPMPTVLNKILLRKF